ncbi:hypothetical protein [Bdellovibrio reynosensis]|uniref:Uncharacterized protein n=1 Tax=Bdellovibrio reynosensis TaxID=2835041 RepID=A0ABY4CCD1_9BACT|nr:hypothetical protein [Bdellovibrio reynosensis]UOF02099.1 hypothetical protein MNR06_03915 [Bdellovibrio reynosensis]
MKFLLALATLHLVAFSAQATTFSALKGTYKIRSCENQSSSPSVAEVKLCESTAFTVDAQPYYTSFAFFRPTYAGGEQVSSFGYPSKNGLGSNDKYEETQSEYLYFFESKSASNFTRIRKLDGNIYHLSLYSKFSYTKTEDLFEIELEKISDEVKPVPIQNDENGCVCCD